jgi:hypothetical protein
MVRVPFGLGRPQQRTRRSVACAPRSLPGTCNLARWPPGSRQYCRACIRDLGLRLKAHDADVIDLRGQQPGSCLDSGWKADYLSRNPDRFSKPVSEDAMAVVRQATDDDPDSGTFCDGTQLIFSTSIQQRIFHSDFFTIARHNHSETAWRTEPTFCEVAGYIHV